MRTNALWAILLATISVVAACGDDEQQPTGSNTTTTSAGGSGATGGGGATGGHSHTGGGGTGGTAGTGGGTAGGGGTGGCMTAEDCGPSSDCMGWVCDTGACMETTASPDTITSSQVSGDCKTNTCGGSVNDDTDVFDDQNDCTVDTCDAGSPLNEAEPEGTACTSNGGSFCDGAKKCVECITGGDCVSGVCSIDHVCAPAECGDTVQNGTETDVDCGGGVCGKCPADKACNVNADCIDGVCDPSMKICKAASCLDNVKNGAETDIDCGGPTCGDCDPGESCGSPNDCTSNVCSGVPLKCQTPTCMDLVKNAAETDVDCGGPTCMDCVAGQLCLVPGDCVSGVCSGTPAKCQVPSCTDTVKNGNETGIDCGGAMCPTCPNDQPCNVNADCMSGFCNAMKLCKTPTCNDGAKNGTETDIDCGGTCVANCADGLSCLNGNDCQSTFCLGTPLTCQPNLNSCTANGFTDLTGQSNVNISFGGFFYTPNCIKVSPGTNVTWDGSFPSHPLQGGTVINFVATPDDSKIPLTNTGTSKTITFGAAGTFPYYCQFHFTSMQGVVLVQ